MFAGHVGAALAAGAVNRRVNAGWVVLAGLWLDAVLWVLVLAGQERVLIPGDFAQRRYLTFDFPYSHGLLAAAVWALLLGAVAWRAARTVSAAGVVASAALSHVVLDLLVHVPDIPVAGAGSVRLGIGLWTRLPVALALETAIALGGLLVYLHGSALAAGRRYWLAFLVIAVTAFTAAGQALAPAPPGPGAVAASSLAMIALVCGFAGWITAVPRRARR